jgi:peptidoglycan hydrolase-like protein with peptidoglycan-binding domain
MFKCSLFFLVILLPLFCGCDRLYGVLHKPGGEERAILGEVVFNEYNAKVELVQKYLRILGYPIGKPDGKFGAGSRDAVAKFQEDEGLEVTRFVDKAAWGRLQYYMQSPLVEKGALSGRGVQQALVKAGYDPGKIDGQLGGKSKSALRAFQKDHGLSPDGLIGLKTFQALLKYLDMPKE